MMDHNEWSATHSAVHIPSTRNGVLLVYFAIEEMGEVTVYIG